jgi:hypothetical protein
VEPRSPLKLSMNGKAYILDTSSNIRQETDALQPNNTTMITESRLDLESQQRLIQCKVTLFTHVRYVPKAASRSSAMTISPTSVGNLLRKP